jgi:site-specific recombinase XerD
MVTTMRKELSNHEAIKEFLKLKLVQNRSTKETISDKTLYVYEKLLKQYDIFLGKPFKDATHDDNLKFLQSGGKNNNGYKPKSQNNIIRLLRQFYRWFYDLDECKPLPKCIRNIKPRVIKIDEIKYREKIVTQEEYNLLIENAQMPMQKALIETYWCFGSRKTSIQSLLVGDVSYDGNVTRIIIRNDKEEPREVVYSDRCEHLMKWRESLSPFKDQPGKPLFVTTWGGTLHQVKQDYARDMLIRICERAGLRHIHPHMFRHTVTSRMLKEGVPSTHVCTQLGFAKNTTMLKVYDHNTTSDYVEWLNRKQRQVKPTYDLLEKQKKTLEEKHEKEISELQNKYNEVEDTLQALQFFIHEVSPLYKLNKQKFNEYKKTRVPELQKEIENKKIAIKQ